MAASESTEYLIVLSGAAIFISTSSERDKYTRISLRLSPAWDYSAVMPCVDGDPFHWFPSDR